LTDFLAGGYQKIPADFSGKYLFHKWNEKLIGGWRIKDGEKVKSIKPSKKDNQKNNKENSRIAGDVVCYTITTTEYQVTCQRGFGCSDPEVIGVYYTTECVYNSTPPPPILVGEGWGGGGGTTPPEADPCEVPDENIGLRMDCEEDIEDIFAEIERLFQKINPCEKRIIMNNLNLLPSIYQVYKNSIHAEEVTNMLYSISEVKEAHNNCADAFRHAYWNALNAISVPGKLAKGLADAHECWATNEKEKEMDLFNNSVGRNIGYGYSFLNIYNINDMRVLQNNIIMNLSWGNLRVIYPLNSDNELMSYSQIVGFDLHCN
jgi:hypothetical protein